MLRLGAYCISSWLVEGRHVWLGVQDNDIILCDGPCGRAYHEKCLDPPIVAAELDPEKPWLCHACDAKVQISTTLCRQAVRSTY